MFIKLSDNRKKALVFIGGFLSLAVLMVALVMAAGYIFFRSYGWFNVGANLKGNDMSVRLRREPFELAVVNDTSVPYDQRPPYVSTDEPIVYLAEEQYALIGQTNGDHPALFF